MSLHFNIPHDAKVRLDMLTKSVKGSFGSKHESHNELSDKHVAKAQRRVISNEPPSIPNTEFDFQNI